MTFWQEWIEWWTGVSAQWNAIDARIQAGEVKLTDAQREAYEAYAAAFGAMENTVREIDADDLAELKLATHADEAAKALFEGATGLVSGALDWVDSLF